MNYRIIDLLAESKVFQESLDASINLDCKFILVTTEETTFLVLGPLREYPYHAFLMAHLAENENIPGNWEKKPDQFALLPTKAKINGGGWFRFDFTNKKVVACGVSTAYGRFKEDILKEFISNGNFYPNLTKIISE